MGIATHLQDANLQQFVNSKTNRPVVFSYQAVAWGGVELGVLTIPLQKRPFFLLRPYGGLLPNTLYVRRGSSTAVADPEEIFRMGAEPQAAPVLRVEFADLEHRALLGTETTLALEVLLPTEEMLKEKRDPPGSLATLSRMVTPDHFLSPTLRQRCLYMAERSAWATIGLAVSNTTEILAENVRVELEVAPGSLQIVEWTARPNPPKRLEMPRSPLEIGRRADVSHAPDGKAFVEAYFGGVQPCATVYCAEPILVGGLLEWHIGLPELPDRFIMRNSPLLKLEGTQDPIELKGRIYGDNLVPSDVVLALSVEITHRDLRPDDVPPRLPSMSRTTAAVPGSRRRA